MSESGIIWLLPYKIETLMATIACTSESGIIWPLAHKNETLMTTIA